MSKLDYKRALNIGLKLATEFSPTAQAYKALTKSYNYSSVGEMDKGYSNTSTPTTRGGSSGGAGGKSAVYAANSGRKNTQKSEQFSKPPQGGSKKTARHSASTGGLFKSAMSHSKPC
jgi:phage tail tape-measure protein